MKESIHHLLNPSSLEPQFGEYRTGISVDNWSEYSPNSIFSRFHKFIDRKITVLSGEYLFLVRLFQSFHSSGASLTIWNQKNGDLKEFRKIQRGIGGFLSKGNLVNGFWNFSTDRFRFNYRVDSLLRQAYLHVALLDEAWNFQLDSLIELPQGATLSTSSLVPSSKDFLYRERSAALPIQGQINWKEDTFTLQPKKDYALADMSQGYLDHAFTLDSRLLSLGSKKNKISLSFGSNPKDESYLWLGPESIAPGGVKVKPEGKNLSIQGDGLDLKFHGKSEQEFIWPALWKKKVCRRVFGHFEGSFKGADTKKTSISDCVGYWETDLPAN